MYGNQTAKLCPSSSIAANTVKAAIARSATFDKFMAVIVWLTHNFQYQASVTALSSMRACASADHQKLSHPRIKDELNLWPSVRIAFKL
jgi:hypothetical protein